MVKCEESISESSSPQHFWQFNVTNTQQTFDKVMLSSLAFVSSSLILASLAGRWLKVSLDLADLHSKYPTKFLFSNKRSPGLTSDALA